MKDQIFQGAQHAASGKAAMTVVVGTATAPSWMQWAISITQSETSVAVAFILGIMVSISIFVINIQSFLIRRKASIETSRQQRIKTALLETEAAEKNIPID